MLGAIAPSCQPRQATPPPRHIPIQQTWELEPGDEVGGYEVIGSLGDVSIELNGGAVRAPFAGDVEAITQHNCIVFSSPEVPAYLFRLCGLRNPHLGSVAMGSVIGKGDYLHFATLRRQPDGLWAIVEPSTGVLERALGSTLQSNAP